MKKCELFVISNRDSTHKTLNSFRLNTRKSYSTNKKTKFDSKLWSKFTIWRFCKILNDVMKTKMCFRDWFCCVNIPLNVGLKMRQLSVHRIRRKSNVFGDAGFWFFPNLIKFSRILITFAQICPNFVRFCPNFAQICPKFRPNLSKFCPKIFLGNAAAKSGTWIGVASNLELRGLKFLLCLQILQKVSTLNPNNNRIV